jgi:hypothetical protein
MRSSPSCSASADAASVAELARAHATALRAAKAQLDVMALQDAGQALRNAVILSSAGMAAALELVSEDVGRGLAAAGIAQQMLAAALDQFAHFSAQIGSSAASVSPRSSPNPSPGPNGG